MNDAAPPSIPTADVEPLPRLGIVLLVALTLVWGNQWPVIKVALDEIPPWTFRAICTMGGAAGLFILCWIGRIPVRVPRASRLPLILLALFNITFWNVLSAYGLSLMPAGRAAIIAFTMPVWVVLFGALFLGEPATPRRLLALGLGIAGLGVLIVPELASVQKAPLGAYFMCAAAITWAIGTTLIKHIKWNMPVVALAAWQIAIGGVPVVGGMLAFEDVTMAPVSTAAMLAVAYSVLICFVFGNYAWTKIVSLFPAGIAGISSLMIPVVGVFSGALFLGETVGLQELSALVLVIGALGAVLSPSVRRVSWRRQR